MEKNDGKAGVRDPAALSLALLGVPLLSRAGEPVLFTRRKSFALLAYLALEPGMHGRDSLSAFLWPERDQVRARSNLRRSLFELEHELGQELFRTAGDQVSLDAGALRIDAAEFLGLVGPCECHVPELACARCESSLTAALRLWRGGFMEGFFLPDSRGFDDWQFEKAGRLRDARVSALRRLALRFAGTARTREAAALASDWINAAPFDEEARRFQIGVLLELGNEDQARERYRTWEALVREELGREPAESTKILIEPSGEDSPPEDPEHRLVGRERELAAIGAALRSGADRLHSITGPGGVGKTSVARALLRLERGAFPGGAWFVDLSALRDKDRLPYAVAASIGLGEREESPAALSDRIEARLGRGRSLVVLDNLEQMPDAARAVAWLLAASARLTLLCTSRVALGLGGERNHALEPLATPPEGASLRSASRTAWPALELFLLRAEKVASGGFVEGPGLEDCARLCARLDGLPLALELAAAALGVLEPAELLARMDRKLDLADAAGRTRPPRHRSLRAVIAWSHELLPPSARALFSALAVFPDGFDVEAAEAVRPGAGDALADLEILVAANLLRKSRAGTKGRLAFLESIRDFALELFEARPDAPEIRRRHALHFLERAERGSSALRGPCQTAALAALMPEEANFEAALDFLAGRDGSDDALRLCAALEWYWYRSGQFASGQRSLEKALAAGRKAPGPLRGACLRALGWLRFTQGAWREARGFYLEALALLEAGPASLDLVRCLADLGVAERWLGDRASGDGRLRRAVELARGLGDPGLLAMALVWDLGTTGGSPGDERQRLGLEEAVRLAREAEDPWIESHAFEALGDLLRTRGDFREAAPCYERALDGFDALGDSFLKAWTLEGLGMNAALSGRADEAEATLRDSLSLFVSIGSRSDAVFVLGELGVARALAGDRRGADLLLGAFGALRRELGLETIAQTAWIASGAPPGAAGPTEAPDAKPSGQPRIDRHLAEAAARSSDEWLRGSRIRYAELPELVAPGNGPAGRPSRAERRGSDPSVAFRAAAASRA